MSYNGAPKVKNKRPVAFVGKGVTSIPEVYRSSLVPEWKI